MDSAAWFLPALLLCALPAIDAQAKLEPDSTTGPTDPVTISLSERRITDKTLRVRYEIKNASDRDIWICDSMDLHSRWADVDVYVGQDNETLFVQRRLDVPIGYRQPPSGRYVRMRSGETRTETMSFSLPVHHRLVHIAEINSQRRVRATRLVLEIGYYEGDLPAMVFRLLQEAEKVAPEEPGIPPDDEPDLLGWLGSSLSFNVRNENMRARDEQVEIRWTGQALKGEKVLRMTVDGLAIPYSSQENKPTPIHLSPCKRIDIRLRRSPLECFFPYPQEQALLSLEERRYLQSLKDFAVEDQWGLMNIAYHASQAKDGTFFTERGVADLTCTRKDGSTVSLTVYDDAYIVTPDGQVFGCLEGIPKLRMLSPQIESFDLRVQCAAKLKNLWHRLRLYHIARHAPGDSEEYWKRYRSTGRIIPPEVFRKPEKTYPQATDWCDAMQRAYQVVYRRAAMMLQQCPSAGKGRCHYAMNPNCKYDSLSDTVLLFETKAGWNQHGGLEMFTFENHDPRGGCVLLNDGTVKFIRTEDEFRQLRWK